jgi:hypothetical protein
MTTSWARKTTVACALVLLLAASGGRAAAAPSETVVSVKGTVTDAGGAPVPGHVVRLLKTRRLKSLSAPHSQSQEVEEARGKTDADGRFTIEFKTDNDFPFWYVRFYDPKEFDAVKYKVPQDVEISRAIAASTAVEVGVVLQMQPDWPKVKGLVDQYGPASRRGQILRNLGLPSSRNPEGEEREIWVYDAAGVSYVLQGDTVIETRHFTPTAAPATPPDTAVPADKVNNP